MATRNFRPMEYGMPLVCGMPDFDEMKEEYEREFGEEYTEGMFDLDCEDFIRNAREMAEEFTSGLKFHTVTVIPGYYQGFQFWIEEKYANYFDLDRASEDCIDNDYARYYFDMCRSKALRAAEAEKRRIIRWLVALDGKGFDILVCKVVFSNGEAIYARLNG